MSKLSELVSRLGQIEFGDEEDADLASRAEGALEEQETLTDEAKTAKADAEDAEERAKEAEVRASEAEVRADEAEVRADKVEQEAEAAIGKVVTLLEEVRKDLGEIREQQKSLDDWRTAVVERHGLVTSSDDEGSNRAGRVSDEPLVSDEDFAAARKQAQGGPMRLWQRIMTGYREKYGELYDVPGASSRMTDRTLGTIRSLQAVRRPSDRPRFV